ncbi:MAG: tRNA (adenosine(37)-N6)-threonylcarbamoyltransferase complex dimerization subunit type 1 TsaB [Chitinophagales bacterium]
MILQIDTTSEICSASIAQHGKLLYEQQEAQPNSHARQLTTLIHQVMQDAGVDFQQISAIAVSNGPGSYTGLRIGASVAKGICLATGLPLIAVPTIKALTSVAITRFQADNALFLGLIDARRNDAYYAIYDGNLNCITTDSFTELDDFFWNSVRRFERPVAIFGDAEKKINLLQIKGFGTIIGSVKTLSSNLSAPAAQYLENKNFVDARYYEPFYLKSFGTK